MCVLSETWSEFMNLDSYFSRSPQARISSIRETDACGLKTILRVTNTINTRVLTVLNPLIFKFRTQVCFFLFFFNVTFLFGWHLVKWRNDWCVYTGLKTYLYATYGTRMFFILGIKPSVTSIRTYFLLSNCQVKSA